MSSLLMTLRVNRSEMWLKVILLILIASSFVSCQSRTRGNRNQNRNVEGDESCGRRFGGVGQSVALSVGGIKVNERTKWPWTVAFAHNEMNNYFCGGSLISNRHVLGAAHCFQSKGVFTVDPPEHVTARLGKFNLSVPNENGTRSLWVSQIIIHPEWDPEAEEYDADITVVVLGEEVKFTIFIKPVCLPPQSEDDVIGRGTIVGWGQSNNSKEFNGKYEDTPMELEMPVIREMKCLTKFKGLAKPASERMFCAGYDNKTKGACFGDSGGGFYALDSSSSRFQVKGIVSSSLVANETCDVNKFSLYTNVGWFVDWIKDSMKETKEIKWTEVELECENTRGFDVYCKHSFAGPFNQNIRMSSTPNFDDNSWNADKIERLLILLENSTHIFSGIGKTFKNLKFLEIYGLSIKFIKRHDFANLSKLNRLKIRYLEITFIPEDTFFDLRALKTLIIGGLKLRTLPPNLFLLSNNLIRIELYDNNELTNIPESSLMSLKIARTDTSEPKNYSFGTWLRNLPELEELELNRLDLSELPENLLPSSKKLKNLDLSENNLKKLDKKIKENIPELEVLNLGWNPIELDGDSFSEFLKLKELNLRDIGLKTLPEGIFDSLYHLEVLNLRDNKLTILPEGVFDSLTQLEDLNLSHNQLTILSENIFAKNLNLKTIDLRENKLTQIQFDFTTLEKIERIDVHWNECISDEGSRWSETSLQDFQNAINTNCH